MTEETMNEDTLPQETELDALKSRADLLGIKYHPSIGVDSLKTKISEHLQDDEPASAEEPVAAAPVSETKIQKNIRIKKAANALVRVRVACMNPAKKEWEGEIFTTGNLVTGTIKKYVPFDREFHVPQMILDMMQARQCQVFFTETDPRTRNKTRKGRLVKEFAIEILPMLTKEELRDLAQRQAMANGTAE